MIAELPCQVCSCSVDLIGGGGSIHRGDHASGDGHIAGRGKSDRDRGLGEECRDAVWSVGISFQFVPTLPVGGSALLELAEPDAAAAEFSAMAVIAEIASSTVSST